MYNGIEIEYRLPNQTIRHRKTRVVCDSREEYEAIIERAEKGEINIVSIQNNDLLQIYRDAKMKRLQDTYALAKERFNTISETKEKIDRSILKRYVFSESERVRRMFEHKTKERITNPKMLYALDVKDLNRFHKLAAPYYKKVGMTSDKHDCYSFMDKMKEELTEIENNLIEYGVSIIGDEKIKEDLLTLCHTDTYRKDILNLIMQLPC